jgi:N-acetylneuraminic acid mutarotase
MPEQIKIFHYFLYLFFIASIASIFPIQNFTEPAYDLKSERLASMPSQRQEVSVVEFEDRFYVIGGIDENGNPSDVVEYYNPKSDTWDNAPSLPKALHHVSAITHENKIYVIGGFETLDGFIPVDTVFEFGGQGWKSRAKMPTKRGGLGLSALDNKIYAIGGADELGSLSTVEIFDPQSNRWKSSKPMNAARDHLVVVQADGLIYAIGGRQSNQWPFKNLGFIEVYNLTEDKWTTLDSKIKARSGLASATLNDKIYLFGGESSALVFNYFEEFNPLTGEVKKFSTNLTPRHGLGAIGYENKLYFIAGAIKAGYGASGLNEFVIVII